MKKIVLIAAFSICSLSAFSQGSDLLEKYRKMAIEYSYDLKSAERNIAASIDIEKMARAETKPSVRADANFQYIGNPTELTLDMPALGKPTTFKGSNSSYGASLSILQPVYTGGMILRSIKLAQQQKSFATNQTEMVKSAVLYQTDIQYWNTVARHEMVTIASDFRNSVSSLVTTVKERVEIGLADPKDLLMAEVKLNEAEYQLLEAKNSFETSRMALNSIIGIELNTPTGIEQTIPTLTFDNSQLSADGSNRPELRMADDQIGIAHTYLQLNDAKYKPQLYAGVDGSYSTPGYNFKPDLNGNYALYAKLSVPIFEWGKRRSEKRASTRNIEIATDRRDKVKDAVRLEVETARVALHQAIQRVDLSNSSLKKAEENERIALERYNEGKTSILEVLDAQTYRQTSQIYYTQAKVAAQCHYSELINAINGYCCASK